MLAIQERPLFVLDGYRWLRPVSWLLILFLLANSACGTTPVADSPSRAVNTTPVNTTPVNTTPVTLTVESLAEQSPQALPIRLATQGWFLTLTQVEVHDTLVNEGETLKPTHGQYLILFLTLKNLDAATSNCVYDENWLLQDERTGQQYPFDLSAASLIYDVRGLDYPGWFRGLCISKGETEETFLVFDVPDTAHFSLLFHFDDGAWQIFYLGTSNTLAMLPTITPSPIPTLAPTVMAATLPTPSPTSLPQGTVMRNANLRAGPGTEYIIVGIASAGDAITIYGRSVDGGWVLISNTGDRWLWAEFIASPLDLETIAIYGTTTLSPTATSYTSNGVYRVRVIVNQINFRAGPGTNYPSLGYLEEGVVLPVMGRNADGGWFQVRNASGQIGWVGVSVVTLLGNATVSSIPVASNIPTPPPSSSQPSLPTATVSQGNGRDGCDPAYPTVCIPPYPPDLDCDEIPFDDFQVLAPDPHRFDRDRDGIGCES